MRRPQALLENPRQVKRISGTDVLEMPRQPIPCGFSAAIPQMGKERPLGIELAGNAESEHRLLIMDRMDMYVAKALSFEILVVDDFPKERERTQFLQQARIECYLVQPVLDVAGGLRNIRAIKRVDLDHDDIARIAFVDQRKEGRIAHIAAIPVGFSVDFHRLEKERQARRRHDAVEVDARLPKDLWPTGADIGRGQEQLEIARIVDGVEVDARGDNVTQWIEIHWV